MKTEATFDWFVRPSSSALRTMASIALGLGLGLVAERSATAAEPLSGDHLATADGDLIIHPVNHASLVLQWKGQTIYVDPVGGAKVFRGLPAPDLILLTDIHGDHFDKANLPLLAGEKAALVAPPAVVKLLPEPLVKRATALANGESHTVLGIKMEAIAAYNLTAERQQYHAKGRGNGYVLNLGGKRIYLSGDTEGTPEMKALKDIDVAFLCMNLPYTMDVPQAAEAVKAFRPKIVYPYHSRGSDLEQFKKLVGTDAGVEVRLRDWYPAP
jgi:L-ascorbate metabolism protein UlaG (beta-lactamase superfamily)